MRECGEVVDRWIFWYDCKLAEFQTMKRNKSDVCESNRFLLAYKIMNNDGVKLLYMVVEMENPNLNLYSVMYFLLIYVCVFIYIHY